MLNELINNNRVVGGINKSSTKKAIEFYSSFVKSKLHQTNCQTAELSKLTENSFRDVNIAFANQLSLLCNNPKIDVNIWELISIVNDHPRVNVLSPGIGVGGHCIAVDPWFIISDFPDESSILKLSRRINLNKTKWVSEDILKKTNKNSKVGILGLSYKPDVDDIRESPAVEIFNTVSNERYFST